MKYMSFNSACAYAGVANMLERMGHNVSDRDIALGMDLPCMFDYADGAYLGGAMLQSADWFNLYLRPRGFVMREESLPAQEVCARLDQLDCAMIGLLIAPGARHAVVYTGREGEGYRFLNNKWENSGEPDCIVLCADELPSRLNGQASLAYLERAVPQEADMLPRLERSIQVLGRMQADMDAFCASERSPQELRAALNPLFRALLLDGVAMTELAGQDLLCAELKALQAQLMSALRSGAPACLQDMLPRMHEAIQGYVRLIQTRIEAERR